MEQISDLTPTQILKLINDTKSKHDLIRQEIIDHTLELDDLEKKINLKILDLSKLEKEYINLIEILNNKE